MQDQRRAVGSPLVGMAQANEEGPAAAALEAVENRLAEELEGR